MFRILLILSCFPFICHSQQLYSDLEYQDTTIHLAPGISVGSVPEGYKAIAPASPKGAIVFFQATGPIDSQSVLARKALEKDLAIIHISTNNKFEFLFSEQKKEQLSRYLERAIDSLDIPADNLHFAGMSLAGTRALIMSLYLTKKYPKLKPKSLVLCDSPLDFVRFYNEGIKAYEGQYHEAAANEGYWTSTYLAKNLGGSAEDNMTAYLSYSPVSRFHASPEHLDLLQGTAVRCYTEPNVHWWMSTRKKDFYGMNTIDMALLINELHKLGNVRAELVLTKDKGYRSDGSYHPHSWNIVDEKEMVEWMVSLD